ncbi:MAG: hypothetical protein ACKVJK_14885, partial [Methylophagaceae bacterium]
TNSGIFNTVTANQVVGDFRGSLFGDDSSVMVDAVDRKIVASTIHGDLTGSVFGDDSSAIIDSTSGTVHGNVINDTVTTSNIIINSNLATGGLFLETEGDGEDDYDLFTFKAYNTGADAPAQQVVKTRGTKASPAAIQNGDGIFRIVYMGYGTADASSSGSAVIVDAEADGAIAANQVPGRYKVQTADAAGALQVAVTFNSKQETVFGGPAQLKSLSTTERNALTAVNGQMIYNSTDSKIQAYAGSTWVNLH